MNAFKLLFPFVAISIAISAFAKETQTNAVSDDVIKAQNSQRNGG